MINQIYPKKFLIFSGIKFSGCKIKKIFIFIIFSQKKVFLILSQNKTFLKAFLCSLYFVYFPFRHFYIYKKKIVKNIKNRFVWTLKEPLLNFNFVIIHIIHKKLVLIKNSLNYLKDNIFECFLQKYNRLLFFLKK